MMKFVVNQLPYYGELCPLWTMCSKNAKEHVNQAIALVNRNHRRKKYDAERLSAGSSSHSPRRFTA